MAIQLPFPTDVLQIILCHIDLEDYSYMCIEINVPVNLRQYVKTITHIPNISWFFYTYDLENLFNLIPLTLVKNSKDTMKTCDTMSVITAAKHNRLDILMTLHYYGVHMTSTVLSHALWNNNVEMVRFCCDGGIRVGWGILRKYFGFSKISVEILELLQETHVHAIKQVLSDSRGINKEVLRYFARHSKN